MVPNKFDLSGKVAMVSGCNTGLGQAMAVSLAEAGADVIGINISEPQETRELVLATGRRFHNIAADLSSIDPITPIMAEAKKVMGRMDILVNNAGIIRREDSIHFSEKDWDDVININLKSVFFMSQALARDLIREDRPGKIINIASMLSFQGGIRVPSYTASKSGVMGLTRLMACEWAGKKINVNAIAPGYMATNNTAQLRADEARSKEILDRIPIGRWGEPGDLAGPVVFLASSASDYVNGYTIAVDGGWLAR